MTTEIKVCMGSACFARGNDRIAELIEDYISENKLDAKIELIGARCNNVCENGPNIYVNGECINSSDEEKVLQILEGIKNE